MRKIRGDEPLNAEHQRPKQSAPSNARRSLIDAVDLVPKHYVHIDSTMPLHNSNGSLPTLSYNPTTG
jgi:hypothetical protein